MSCAIVSGREERDEREKRDEGVLVEARRGGEERTSTLKSRERRVECQELRVARRDEPRVVGIRKVKVDVESRTGIFESRESRVGESKKCIVSIKALGSRLESDRAESSQVELRRVASS